MLKKKNLYVITITLSVVFLIFVSSFLGFVVYLQWRQLDFTVNYYEALERLDTISDSKNIVLDSIAVRLGFEGLPLVEGRINNKGKRTVISAAIKVNFMDSAGNPVFSYVVYPMEPFRPPRFFRKVPFQQLVLLRENLIKPNASVSFKCAMWGCPKKIIKSLKKKSFSDSPGEWNGKVGAEVLSIRLKPEGSYTGTRG